MQEIEVKAGMNYGKITKAYQNAESTWLAPLDYFYLVFACFWGKIIFDNFPTFENFIGLFLISFSGIIIAVRERINRFK